jgi:mannosyltransferase
VSPAAQPRFNSATLLASLSRHRASWLVLALTLLAAGLRFYRLGHKSIWWDEGFSVFLARLPIAEMVMATAHDTHPPGFYALLHFWRLAAGDSEVSVRLLSALAGVLIVPLAFRLVRPLGGSRAALAAAGLLAINRVHIG